MAAFRVDRVVAAPGGGGSASPLELSALDAFEARFGGPHFCYEFPRPLDAARVTAAFGALLRECPWLGGSIDAVEADVPARLAVCCGAPGHVEVVVNARPVEAPTASEWDGNAIPRRLYAARVDENAGSVVAAGPLCRARVAELVGGGGWLSVTLGHGVADAAARDALMRRWASLCRGEPGAAEDRGAAWRAAREALAAAAAAGARAPGRARLAALGWRARSTRFGDGAPRLPPALTAGAPGGPPGVRRLFLSAARTRALVDACGGRRAPGPER